MAHCQQPHVMSGVSPPVPSATPRLHPSQAALRCHLPPPQSHPDVRAPLHALPRHGPFACSTSRPTREPSSTLRVLQTTSLDHADIPHGSDKPGRLLGELQCAGRSQLSNPPAPL